VHGEKGWSEGMSKQNSTGNVTHLQFYAYRIAIRNEFNPILHGGKLFQQFVVDIYVRIEANTLNWIKFNQKKLRAESYLGLVDYVAGLCDQHLSKLGKLVILPSSFQGSPRAMHQNYQDAMSIVSCHSNPDLFITMTCNPNWIEIISNLYPNQTASDRPDLVARVFNIKLNELIDDVTKQHIFGEVEAYFYTIEFQKRGLPHAHILAILKDKDKIRDPETIDKIISAELPDQNTQPKLFKAVVKHMIHRSCGRNQDKKSPCLNEKLECTKKFPKPFSDSTVVGEDGFPKYRKRDDKREACVRVL